LNSLSANGRDWHRLNIDVVAKKRLWYRGIRWKFLCANFSLVANLQRPGGNVTGPTNMNGPTRLPHLATRASTRCRKFLPFAQVGDCVNTPPP